MKQCYLAPLLFLTFSCAAAETSPDPATADLEPTFGFPADSERLRRLNPDEAKALLIAIVHRGTRSGREPTLRDFDVARKADGSWVVKLESGMWDGGRLFGFPSGFTVVNLRADWTVASVVGGA